MGEIYMDETQGESCGHQTVEESENDLYILKSRNLSEVILDIDHPSFIYINRSCVVNLNHVRLLDSDHLYLFNYEKPLYISRNQFQSVKKKYIHNH